MDSMLIRREDALHSTPDFQRAQNISLFSFYHHRIFSTPKFTVTGTGIGRLWPKAAHGLFITPGREPGRVRDLHSLSLSLSLSLSPCFAALRRPKSLAVAMASAMAPHRQAQSFKVRMRGRDRLGRIARVCDSIHMNARAFPLIWCPFIFVPSFSGVLEGRFVKLIYSGRPQRPPLVRSVREPIKACAIWHILTLRCCSAKIPYSLEACMHAAREAVLIGQAMPR